MSMSCVAAMGIICAFECMPHPASILCSVFYSVCYYIAANAVAAITSIASILATAKALMLLLLFLPKYHLSPDLPRTFQVTLNQPPEVKRHVLRLKFNNALQHFTFFPRLNKF